MCSDAKGFVVIDMMGRISDANLASCVFGAGANPSVGRGNRWNVPKQQTEESKQKKTEHRSSQELSPAASVSFWFQLRTAECVENWQLFPLRATPVVFQMMSSLV